MKKKEDNSFQLLFTALVLVIIAVGGTLAWFASSSTSSVDQIGVSMTDRTDGNGFGGEPLDYCPAGEFEEFEGVLTYVPGKNMLFRVKAFAHADKPAQLVFEGTSMPELGSVVKVAFFSSIQAGWRNDRGGLEENLYDKPTQTLSELATTVPGYGKVVSSGNVHTAYDSVDNCDYLYFLLYMDPAAGEEPAGLQPDETYRDYQNLDLTFKVGVGINMGS